MDSDLVIAGASISALIVSFIQLAKGMFPDFIKKNAPFIAILLGLVAAFFYNQDVHKFTTFQTIIVGISLGFQASGIYAASTGTLKGEKKEVETQLQQLSVSHAVQEQMMLKQLEISQNQPSQKPESN